MSVWILLLYLTGGTNSIHQIDGFPTEQSCEAARIKIDAAADSPFLKSVCIELPWEDAGAMR